MFLESGAGAEAGEPGWAELCSANVFAGQSSPRSCGGGASLWLFAVLKRKLFYFIVSLLVLLLGGSRDAQRRL